MTNSEVHCLEIVKNIVNDYVNASIKESPINLAPDVEWILSGSIDDPLTGVYHGPEQVKELYAKFNQITKDQIFEPTEYIVNDNKVVLWGTETITFIPSGHTVKSSFTYIVTLNDKGEVAKWHAMYGYP